VSGNTSASRVVRNQTRNWILGFNHFLGKCSPFEAKIWGILDGLLVLLNKGYKRATIQTDNLEVVRALTMEEQVGSGITLLRMIQRLLCSEGQWEIKYVP
ncbi:hypothetical protein Goari_010486, partial [Gossypium aridum]|nr:hypothetical protein [Gossypium aridum]